MILITSMVCVRVGTGSTGRRIAPRYRIGSYQGFTEMELCCNVFVLV